MSFSIEKISKECLYLFNARRISYHAYIQITIYSGIAEYWKFRNIDRIELLFCDSLVCVCLIQLEFDRVVFKYHSPFRQVRAEIFVELCIIFQHSVHIH